MLTQELAEGVEDAGGGSMTQQPCLYLKKLPTGGDGEVHSYLLIVRIMQCIHYTAYTAVLFIVVKTEAKGE